MSKTQASRNRKRNRKQNQRRARNMDSYKAERDSYKVERQAERDSVRDYTRGQFRSYDVMADDAHVGAFLTVCLVLLVACVAAGFYAGVVTLFDWILG